MIEEGFVRETEDGIGKGNCSGVRESMAKRPKERVGSGRTKAKEAEIEGGLAI
jgi:hypothetical protein